MNKLYYVDPNGVLTMLTPMPEKNVPAWDFHFLAAIDEDGVAGNYTRSQTHATKQSALQAQRAIFEKEAKTELQNIFLANQRHGKLMQRLVDIDIELYDLRKGEGLHPITDTQVKL